MTRDFTVAHRSASGSLQDMWEWDGAGQTVLATIGGRALELPVCSSRRPRHGAYFMARVNGDAFRVMPDRLRPHRRRVARARLCVGRHAAGLADRPDARPRGRERRAGPCLTSCGTGDSVLHVDAATVEMLRKMTRSHAADAVVNCPQCAPCALCLGTHLVTADVAARWKGDST